MATWFWQDGRAELREQGSYRLALESTMMEWYAEDLAYIHDVVFGDDAIRSAPGLLEILHRSRISGGLVVDLGCGSGLWAEQLVRANYQVLGIDLSEPMIKIARKRVPAAVFRVESLFK